METIQMGLASACEWTASMTHSSTWYVLSLCPWFCDSHLASSCTRCKTVCDRRSPMLAAPGVWTACPVPQLGSDFKMASFCDEPWRPNSCWMASCASNLWLA
jgi:hypothetical protein